MDASFLIHVGPRPIHIYVKGFFISVFEQKNQRSEALPRDAKSMFSYISQTWCMGRDAWLIDKQPKLNHVERSEPPFYTPTTRIQAKKRKKPKDPRSWFHRIWIINTLLNVVIKIPLKYLLYVLYYFFTFLLWTEKLVFTPIFWILRGIAIVQTVVRKSLVKKMLHIMYSLVKLRISIGLLRVRMVYAQVIFYMTITPLRLTYYVRIWILKPFEYAVLRLSYCVTVSCIWILRPFKFALLGFSYCVHVSCVWILKPFKFVFQQCIAFIEITTDVILSTYQRLGLLTQMCSHDLARVTKRGKKQTKTFQHDLSDPISEAKGDVVENLLGLHFTDQTKVIEITVKEVAVPINAENNVGNLLPNVTSFTDSYHTVDDCQSVENDFANCPCLMQCDQVPCISCSSEESVSSYIADKQDDDYTLRVLSYSEERESSVHPADTSTDSDYEENENPNTEEIAEHHRKSLDMKETEVVKVPEENNIENQQRNMPSMNSYEETLCSPSDIGESKNEMEDIIATTRQESEYDVHVEIAKNVISHVSDTDNQTVVGVQVDEIQYERESESQVDTETNEEYCENDDVSDVDIQELFSSEICPETTNLQQITSEEERNSKDEEGGQTVDDSGVQISCAEDETETLPEIEVDETGKLTETGMANSIDSDRSSESQNGFNGIMIELANTSSIAEEATINILPVQTEQKCQSDTTDTTGQMTTCEDTDLGDHVEQIGQETLHVDIDKKEFVFSSLDNAELNCKILSEITILLDEMVERVDIINSKWKVCQSLENHIEESKEAVPDEFSNNGELMCLIEAVQVDTDLISDIAELLEDMIESVHGNERMNLLQTENIQDLNYIVEEIKILPEYLENEELPSCLMMDVEVHISLMNETTELLEEMVESVHKNGSKLQTAIKQHITDHNLEEIETFTDSSESNELTPFWMLDADLSLIGKARERLQAMVENLGEKLQPKLQVETQPLSENDTAEDINSTSPRDVEVETQPLPENDSAEDISSISPRDVAPMDPLYDVTQQCNELQSEDVIENLTIIESESPSRLLFEADILEETSPIFSEICCNQEEHCKLEDSVSDPFLLVSLNKPGHIGGPAGDTMEPDIHVTASSQGVNLMDNLSQLYLNPTLVFETSTSHTVLDGMSKEDLCSAKEDLCSARESVNSKDSGYQSSETSYSSMDICHCKEAHHTGLPHKCVIPGGQSLHDIALWDHDYSRNSFVGDGGSFNVMLAFAAFGQAGPARSISESTCTMSELPQMEHFLCGGEKDTEIPPKRCRSANFPLISYPG